MSENIRRRGAQPGNHNALKHGCYIAKEDITVDHYSDADQVTVIDHLIRSIKRQMLIAAERGEKTQNLQEVLKTMNSLSMAAIGLCRLIHLYNNMTRSPNPVLPVDQIANYDALLANQLAFLGINPSDLSTM